MSILNFKRKRILSKHIEPGETIIVDDKVDILRLIDSYEDGGYNIELFGDSFIFGVGNDIEDTFAYNFKLKCEEYLNHRVNLVDFGVNGASNDLILRMILNNTQVKFDFNSFDFS